MVPSECGKYKSLGNNFTEAELFIVSVHILFEFVVLVMSYSVVGS